MIGAGSLTFLEHATAYVLAVLILTGPGVGVGAAIGAFYGAARALPLVLTWISDVRAARRLQWERLFDLRRATTAVLCIAAVATVLATRVAASV
jgi:Na+/H+ antiporter NhaC